MTAEAIVCIPTFRRPDGLKRTLESLAAQTASISFAVVVVENDAQKCEGKSVADAFFASQALHGFAVVEAKQGNAHAINTAFKTAMTQFPKAEFFLMVDDDEEAAPTWLERMVTMAKTNAADLVGGPVVRHFEVASTLGLEKHPLFYSTIDRSGETRVLHGTGNCLIRRRVLDTLGEPALDPRFNLLGGGDQDFFIRSTQAGFKSCWNQEATVHETVPSQRMKARWVLARSITTGVINYTVDQKRYVGSRGTAWLILKNLGSLAIAPIRAVRAMMETGHWLVASHPICFSIGRNLAALGLTPKPYHASNVTPSGAARDGLSRLPLSEH